MGVGFEKNKNLSILHSVKRRNKRERKETKQTFVRTISPTEKKMSEEGKGIAYPALQQGENASKAVFLGSCLS